MKLIKTPLEIKPLVNTYIVSICYEHGDADAYTGHDVEIKDRTEDEIISYITKFEELAELIDKNRSYRDKLNQDFEIDSAWLARESHLAVEFDNQYQGSGWCYANMWIKNIKFYDNEGSAFTVQYK